MTTASVSPPSCQGHCDPAFSPVRDAFLSNFAERQELGASVAVAVGERLVVDLWGGSASGTGAPWQSDTLVDIFSVGKAMVALSLLLLVERGALRVDDRVCDLWPEFAAAGKDSITVAQLMSHQAGLPGIRQPLGREAMYDWHLMTSALADETPWWEPGSDHGYHVNTFGFLGGDLVRRASGRPFSRFFAEEVAGPLEADFHFGLSLSDQRRVATFEFPEGAELAAGTNGDPLSLVYANPPGISGLGTVNSAPWRSAVHPSTNGHANARAVALIYQALARARTSKRRPILEPETLRMATTELAVGPDRILGRSTRFGFGFQLSQPERPLGPGSAGFGHFGAGGSLGFADPEAQVAFGYAMNRFGHRWQDPRNQALVAAVYACL